MIARTRWNADADMRLRLLWADRKQDIRQVARQLGRTVASIRNRVAALRNNGLIPQEQRGIWTADEDAAFIALRREGLTAQEIATRLNRTKHAINSRVSFLGLTNDAPTPRTNVKPRQTLATKRTARPCLCCRRKFASRGAGNRLCEVCRRLDAGPQPAIIHR